MYITRQVTNEHLPVHVLPVDDIDFKRITVKRYSFSWKKLKAECLIYKLTLIDSDDILGLIALIDYPD